MAATECPCCSGARYRDCCAPFHRGRAEAPTAVALMRSRYAAFALKEIEYLWRSLHPEHPDRARPSAEVLRELRTMAWTFRFPRLQVLDADGPDANGVARVLFLAGLFERGKDRSFVERSCFLHDGTGWRYRSGETRPPTSMSGPIEEWTLDRFPSGSSG